MLEEINVFLHLVENKSFSKTSRQMGLSPATVTRRIVSLEKKLGMKLLKRNTRTVFLTQEGWYCFERWKKIPEIVSEVEENLRNSKASLQGEINISVSVYSAFFVLIPLIADFLKIHPNIKINFVKSNIHPDLIDDNYDVFFRYSEINTRVFQSKKLNSYELITVASPQYLSQHGIPKNPQQLGEHNCIIHRVNAHEGEIWHFKKKEKDIAVKIKGNLYLNNSALVLEALLAGIGIARVPRFFVAPYLEQDLLIETLPEYVPPSLSAYIIYPRAEYLLGKVQVFVDFMLDAFSKKDKSALLR